MASILFINNKNISTQLWQLGNFLKQTRLCTNQLYRFNVPYSGISTDSTVVGSYGKPFSEMPSRPNFLGLQMLVEFLLVSYRGKFHELMNKGNRKFGKLYKGSLGSQPIVYIADPDALAQFYQQEAALVTPQAGSMDSWRRWRKENNVPLGIVVSNDSEWRRMRSALNRILGRPTSVAPYLNTMSKVSSEFVEYLFEIQNTTSLKEGIPLREEMFKWAFESVGHLLYSHSFGTLLPNVDPELQQFANAARHILGLSVPLMFVPYDVARKVMPKTFKQHHDYWNTLFTFGTKLLDSKIEEIQGQLSRGEDVSSMLAKMLSNDKLTTDDIYGNVIDLMIGALDTTTVSMYWVIYMLTQHPDVTKRLQSEVDDVIGSSDTITSEHLSRMVYLKAVLKETLRLYPVAVGNSRRTTIDMNIGGYHIPQQVLVMTCIYSMGRDPELFDKPELFNPDRWLGDKSSSINKYAALPFGFGARGCIGKNFAEQQIYILTIKIIQKCRLELIGPKRTAICRGLLFPDPPLKINFTRR